jgi:hypothetical protein
MLKTKKTFPLILLTLLWTTVAAQEIFEESRGLFSTRQLEASVPQGAKAVVEIRAALTLRGSLEITTQKSEEIKVQYYKRARTTDQTRANDYIDLVTVQLDQTPAAVRLDMRAPNPAPWETNEYGLVDAYLFVPESCAVQIDAAYFDVVARGPFVELINKSSLGRLEASDVHGRTDLITANSRLKVSNMSGEVSVATSNSTLTASDITCLESQASLRNDGGDIIVDGFTGGLNVKTSYGRIDIDDLRPMGRGNYIRGVSGPILVSLAEMTDGQLVLANRYDDIELIVPAGLSAMLTLAVDEDGKIEATNFEFKTELVQTTRLNLVAGQGIGLISGSIRGKGNIYVRGADEEY